jgi:hypothetical protein
MIRPFTVLLVSLLLLSVVAHSGEASALKQDSIGTQSGCVTFVGDGARFEVMMDTLMLGATPITGLKVSAGMHIFTFIPSSRRWTDLAVVETLTIAPGDVLIHTVSPRRMVQVTSEPQGASVISGDSVVGTTPLFLDEIAFGKRLRISKPGFRPVDVSPEETQTLTHSVLIPDGSLPEPALGPAPLLIGEPSMTSVYITTAATVVAGVSAAYFKIKSDGYYSDFLRTGDRALIDRVHHNDVAAGVSLAISQIGIGVLTYLLLSR